MLVQSVFLLVGNIAVLVFSGIIVPEKSICLVHQNSRLPNPNDCSKFYNCKDGETVPGKCREGLLYNPGEGRCVENMDESDCINNNKNLLSAEPYGSSCKQYIMWFNGKGVIRQCGEGLTFNEITTRCDFNENVECADTICSDILLVANVKSPQSCTR